MKQVEKMYLENAGSKKYAIVDFFMDLVIFAILAFIASLPVATVDGISIGNSYEMCKQFIEVITTNNPLYNGSVGYIVGFMFSAVVLTSMVCVRGIGLLIILPLAINKNNKEKRTLVNPNTADYWVYTVSIVFIGVVLFLLLDTVLGKMASSYGFKTHVAWCLVVFLLSPNFKGIVLPWFAVKFCDPKFERVEKKNIGPVATAIIIVVVLSVGLGGVYVAIVNELMYSKEAIFLVEGANDEEREISILHYQTSYQTYIINHKFNWSVDMNGGNYEYIFYGHAYKYYSCKVAEIHNEIEEILKGKAKDEQAYEKKLNKIADLEEKLEVFERRLEEIKTVGAYEYLKFDSGYGGKKFNVYYYDAQPNVEDSIKWGKKAGFFDALYNKESVRIVDAISYYKDLKFFVLGTDFTSNTIVVEMKYADGSYRMESITPDNAKELNDATAGKHTLKWSNEWGSYELEIEIREYEEWMDE